MCERWRSLLTGPVGSDIRSGEELRLDYGKAYWQNHLGASQEAGTAMEVVVEDDEGEEPDGAAIIDHRPPSSKTRRKPGPGRDSEYFPELENDDDGF